MTTIYEGPRYHSDGPDTSREAAETNTTSGTHQDTLLAAFRDVLNSPEPDYTDEEAGRATDIDTTEARRRCNNLRNLGYIEFTGDYRMGIRYAHKRQNVSRITHAGLDALGVYR